jgi:hypothetical protein
MLSQLLSDPPLLSAVVLMLGGVFALAGVYARIYREGQQSGVTTAAELRKDAQTSARQKNLRKMQGRAAARGAFSRRQDLRENRSGKGSTR